MKKSKNSKKIVKENRPLPDPERSFSWSAISSFEWNKEQWWNKYVLHQKCTYEDPIRGTCAFCAIAGFADPECPVVKKTIELAFGTYVDTKIQEDPTFIPALVRYPILQHVMRCEFNGIKLVGIADTYRPEVGKIKVDNFRKTDSYSKETFWEVPLKPALRDYKTGRNKWDQKRADETGQLTMYCLFLWLIEKIKPEEVELWIDWLPTHTKNGKIEFVKEGEVKSFRTKRTMKQVLEFGQRIINTHNAMVEYSMNRPVLDTSDWSQW